MPESNEYVAIPNGSHHPASRLPSGDHDHAVKVLGPAGKRCGCCPHRRERLRREARAIVAGCPGRISHDFRRTAVRNLVRAGVPERVAMQPTGHKTRAVFERDNIVSAGDLREAAQRLDTLCGRNRR